MKEKILELIIYESLWYESDGVVRTGFIAQRLNLTKYKTKKYIDELVSEGMIEKAISPGGWSDDGPYPPRKGYTPTKQTEQTELYKRIEKKQHDDFAKMCY